MNENTSQRKPYNRRKAEYVNELNTEDLIQLVEYNGHQFDRYYFDLKTDTLYLLTRNKYKVVKPILVGKLLVVSLKTTSGKNINFSYKKLLREFKEFEEVE